MCWRLARQLAREHAAPVTLVIDLPRALAAIAPGARPGTTLEGVAIEAWPGPACFEAQPCVVVSAFGCELPGQIRAALAPGASPAGSHPLWVNLEYLSAETWVEGCHGLASRKPGDAAIEHFYYPGFTSATGGLLRERSLPRDPEDTPAASAADAGTATGTRTRHTGSRRVSLFCYPHAPVAELLELLAGGETPTTLLVAEGVAETELARFAGALPATGEPACAGMLRIERFALLPQPRFDRLLESCDLNFVRGEDSWLRAIWAGRPFVWQPYPQQSRAHAAKLDAFLGRFGSIAGGAPEEAAALMRAWSDARGLREAWAAFDAALERIAPAYLRLRDALAAQSDLATRLVEFCRVRL